MFEGERSVLTSTHFLFRGTNHKKTVDFRSYLVEEQDS